MTKYRNLSLVAWFVAVLLVSGCAGIATSGQQYNAEQVFAVDSAIDLQAASDLALEVCQQQEVTITGSSLSSGFISGLVYRGSGINRMSFFVDIYVGVPQPGQVRLKVTSTAGPEVAMTTDLDDIAEEFVRAYAEAASR